MHFICRSFIGKNNSNCWSQYWENEPDDNLKLTKGHLFGLINLKNQQDGETVTIGHDIITRLNELYFSQKFEDINLSLENSLNLLSQNPTFLNYQIDIALVVISNDKVYISTLGDNNCILQRDKLISLLVSGKPNQVVSSCGSLLDNDRILLTSLKFFETITWDNIKKILVDSKIQNIEENFLSLLYKTSDQNQASAALIECHQDDQNIINKTAHFDEADQIITQSAPTPIVSPPPTNQSKPDSIFVHRQPNFKVNRRKKIQLVVAIILIICLLVSICFGNQKNKSKKTESQFINLKTDLKQKLNNIDTIKGLDLDAAVKTANEAKLIVNQMINLNTHQQEVSQYKSQIDTLLFQTGSHETVNLQMILDTSFIVSQPQFSHLYFSDNNLFLFDSTKGRLDSYNLLNKSNQNLIISDSAKSATHLLFSHNTPFLLKDNFLSVVEKNDLILKFDFSSIDTPLTITDINFWNDSLYVLDNQNQSIWKLSPNTNGFSAPQKWLKNDIKLEIGANSLAIDGQIWVLNHSGQIELFTSGLKEKFNQKKTINFTKTISIKTDPNSDFLVFSDNSEFIYVYRKNGNYYSKYNLSKYKIIDFAFDSANKTIYFLSSDQKIYKIIL